MNVLSAGNGEGLTRKPFPSPSFLPSWWWGVTENRHVTGGRKGDGRVGRRNSLLPHSFQKIKHPTIQRGVDGRTDGRTEGRKVLVQRVYGNIAVVWVDVDMGKVGLSWPRKEVNK